MLADLIPIPGVGVKAGELKSDVGVFSTRQARLMESISSISAVRRDIRIGCPLKKQKFAEIVRGLRLASVVIQSDVRTG